MIQGYVRISGLFSVDQLCYALLCHVQLCAHRCVWRRGHRESFGSRSSEMETSILRFTHNDGCHPSQIRRSLENWYHHSWSAMAEHISVSCAIGCEYRQHVCRSSVPEWSSFILTNSTWQQIKLDRIWHWTRDHCFLFETCGCFQDKKNSCLINHQRRRHQLSVFVF